MTAIRYIRRPHRAAHPTWEYVHASRDWSVWTHVAYFVALVAVLVLAVTCAGGSFSVGN